MDNFNEISRYNPFPGKPIIEFAGLKLYLDDLLILGILFFLYKEGVKDNLLFLFLVFLLFTSWTLGTFLKVHFVTILRCFFPPSPKTS